MIHPTQYSQTTNSQRLLATLNKIVWMAALAAFYWLAERQQDGLIQDVWTAAKTASPFAAMFCILLFFDERRERREAQRQCQDRTIEFIEANNYAHASLEKAIDLLSKRRGRK